MAAIHVDTMEDFLRVRGTLEPVYITSRSRGRVLVPSTNTILVRLELVVANTYNPNAVPAEKMLVLAESIVDNGFCFPVVTIWDDESGRFVIVDGFHRRLMATAEWLDLDYLPVVVLTHGMARRMIATWQFNKARGMHQVDLDADLIRKLIDQGVTEQEIAAKLGIDLDTVHRYKQLTGVAALFAKSEWSLAWTMAETAEEPGP